MTVNKKADFEETFNLSEDLSEYHLEDAAQMADDMAYDMKEDMAEDQAVFVVDEEEMQEFLPGSPVAIVEFNNEEEVKETDWENDGDHSKFMVWFHTQLSNLPQHSGQTTVGCERVIAALNRLDRELSKAIQTDINGLIDEEEAEKLRDTIYDWKDKLEEAKSKLMNKKMKNKKSSFRIGKEVVARFNDGKDIQYFIAVGNDEGETLLKVTLAEPTDEQVARFLESELTKEAATTPVMTLVEDPFLHSITRMLIQSHITHGKDMEQVYANFKDKYNFTAREELSIQELLHQKGFPLVKDLGRVGDGDIRPSEGKGVEHSTEYYA